MKSLKNSIKKALIITFAVFCLNSCKKNSTQTPVITAETGNLFLHLHTNVDTNEVDYNTIYNLSNGRKISVNLAQMYLSNIQLIKDDGSFYNCPTNLILKVQELEAYLLGSVPTGNYKSIRFTVGLDSITNLKTPTTNDTALNNNSMWFGSSAQPKGYVYINFQGMIDTSDAGNKSNLLPFMYMIGTNNNSRQVTMPNQNYVVSKGQAQFIHIIIDYSKLLEGIKLNNSNNLMIMTPAENSNSLAISMSNHIANMFSYEE